jgi:FixJ family two-component response regulator
MRVLHIDENALDREMVRVELEATSDFSLVTVATRSELHDYLGGPGCFDVVLSDLGVIGYAGLEIICAVRASRPQLPLIIFTARGTEEIAVDAMKLGAADYLIKSPSQMARLPVTFRAVIEREQLRRENERARQELERFFALAHDMFFVLDRNGIIYRTNPVGAFALARFGVAESPPSILGAIFHLDVATFRNELSRAADGRQGDFQCIVRTNLECEVACWWKWNATWSQDAERFFAVVREATAGKTAEAARAMFMAISPRERQVLSEVAVGKPNKAIASRLDLSEKTIERHRANGMRKLGLRTVPDLVRLVMIKDVIEAE